MLKKKAILDFLINEGFSEVEMIDYNSEIKVFKFFYEFDGDESESAREYANENYDEDYEEEDDWYGEYFLPYLSDIASDNIRDIFDDICEENELNGEFVIYELDRNNYEKCEVVMAFGLEGCEVDLDSIINELDL